MKWIERYYPSVLLVLGIVVLGAAYYVDYHAPEYKQIVDVMPRFRDVEVNSGAHQPSNPGSHKPRPVVTKFGRISGRPDGGLNFSDFSVDCDNAAVAVTRCMTEAIKNYLDDYVAGDLPIQKQENK